MLWTALAGHPLSMCASLSQQQQHNQLPQRNDDDACSSQTSKRYAKNRGIRPLTTNCTRIKPTTRTNGSLTPSQRAKDLTSICEPVATESNLTHPSFFSLRTFAPVSTRCRLTVSLEVRLFPQRSTLNQISDVFYGRIMTPSLLPTGSDTQHLLDPCCHCHCQPVQR